MVWSVDQLLQNGKYKIQEILGQGGFGITYKALHRQLGQSVVIKTPNESLHREPDYEKYVERFIKEGQTLARLSQNSHAHIVRVIDLFQEGNIHCLVMDYVPGNNLMDVVSQKGALLEEEILLYIQQIGAALTVVHQSGLVHRDAHPGNIMLRGNGRAILIDFGIAGELIPTTVSSKHFGNIGFAPYEQMKGDRNPTVDVYCLAATLYYAVTGQKPPTSLDRKLYKTRLIPPKEIIPGISEKLNKAILKGMALEAKNRPQTMPDWLKMLEASQSVKSQIVKPPIPWFALSLYILFFAVIGFLLATSHKPPHPSAIGGAIAGMLTVIILGSEKYEKFIEAGFVLIIAAIIMFSMRNMPSSWTLVAAVPAGIFVWLGAILSVLSQLKIIGWDWASIGFGIIGFGIMGVAFAMSWVGNGNWGIALAMSAVLMSIHSIVIKKQDETVLNSAFTRLFVVLIFGIPGALVGAGIAAWLGIGAVNGAWVGEAAGALAVAAGWFSWTNNENVSDRLLKRFSKSQTVLTIAITSAVGLALGWFAPFFLPR
jgi:tRNA A-37 threonylcarbamoyl transferase component Bud32